MTEDKIAYIGIRAIKKTSKVDYKAKSEELWAAYRNQSGLTTPFLNTTSAPFTTTTEQLTTPSDSVQSVNGFGIRK